ncbi:MAG: VTT domain-containing protein [Minisyncoccia bacterium]
MFTYIINLLDPTVIIQTLGLAGIFFIVFAESGLFFGFFLPGDSLLFTAGFLASQGYLNVHILAWGAFICAILGDSFGYYFGQKIGPKIFIKEDSLFFKKDYVKKAQDFYEKYGNKTIILARFIPIVRTFAPIVAGVGQMKYPNFLTYNIIGAFLWSFTTIYLGNFLGNVVPNADTYILPIILIIILVSFFPIIWEIIKKMNKN